jgi:phenylpropionate dioxygenase-like ring-hydroxylating dioxygenase large terminal subunit
MRHETDPIALESAALDAWYVAGRSEDVTADRTLETHILGAPVSLARRAEGVSATGPDGRALPVIEDYGHVWTTLGQPNAGLFAIPEFHEADRRIVVCGGVRVRASGLRLIENFLDLAHFPFVHTDILGVVERPEVTKYDVEIRADVDEVWATNCQFWQPKAAAQSAGGQMSDYTYRVVSPFNVLLYKTCPSDAARMDAIALFVQPVAEDVSLAFAAMALIDAQTPTTSIIHFQQTIFLQDRIILENQRPRLLPLSPRSEIPTRADLTSVVYRRWLKEKGLRFGTVERAA